MFRPFERGRLRTASDRGTFVRVEEGEEAEGRRLGIGIIFPTGVGASLFEVLLGIGLGELSMNELWKAFRV